jgi:hypothetical protein
MIEEVRERFKRARRLGMVAVSVREERCGGKCFVGGELIARAFSPGWVGRAYPKAMLGRV